MLYGKKEIQDEILERVKEFENKYNKHVIFGAVLGSLSKGVEKYDSDYDIRFLYLDKVNGEYFRWDQISDSIKESQIHYRYFFGDENSFCDKLGCWELTSYINFLRNPQLDDIFSVGLYHFVGWTFHSPYCWDPYGIKSKILHLLDIMFQKKYEVQYYRNYIMKYFQKEKCFAREYLYSAYYAMSIQYCIENNRFAPVYFPTLIGLCKDPELKTEIKKITTIYLKNADELIRQNTEGYKRQITHSVYTQRSKLIDNYISDILTNTQEYESSATNYTDKDCVEEIIEIILNSINRPKVKDVN